MTTLTVAITGATSGLGRAVALILVEQGHHVVGLVRNPVLGADLVDEAARRGRSGQISIVECDLASLAAVRAAVNGFECGKHPRPDAIICNAGLQVIDGMRRSEQGYELTMAVNVLAHQRLITGLIPLLEPGARIVMLGSETHRGGMAAWGFPAPRWTDPTALFDPGFNASASSRAGRVRYANSKLACIYLATEINRRFGANGVVANTYDPGLMPDTGLDRDYPSFVQRIYRTMVPLIVRLPGARLASDSAADLAWLVTAPEPGRWQDAYVSRRQRRAPSPLAQEAANAEQLWDACDNLAATATTGPTR